MSKSERVSSAAELAVVRVVNECRELGDDATAWQLHFVEGLIRLTGGMLASVGPVPGKLPRPPGELPPWVDTQTAGGWPTAAIRERWLAWGRDPRQVMAHPAVANFLRRPEPGITLTRRELVADDAWEASHFVNEFLRPDGMDEGLVSRRDVPVAGASYMLTVVRAAGDRPFSAASGRLVELAQRELAPHLGRSLLLTTQPSRHGLTPRAREVLDCLLDGDSEKQAALRLGLRVTTVHGHVKRLYVHFGVASRAELLAYFLRRHRR